jgi:hypothetical protein
VLSPPSPLWYPLDANVPELAPARWMLRLERQRFERVYRLRLDALGVDAVHCSSRSKRTAEQCCCCVRRMSPSPGATDESAQGGGVRRRAGCWTSGEPLVVVRGVPFVIHVSASTSFGEQRYAEIRFAPVLEMGMHVEAFARVLAVDLREDVVRVVECAASRLVEQELRERLPVLIDFWQAQHQLLAHAAWCSHRCARGQRCHP